MGLDKDKIEKLISYWYFTTHYSALGDGKLPNFLNDDVNDVELEFRDEIHDAGLDNHPEVIKLDREALKIAFDWKFIGYRDKPPQANDKRRWWWWLDELVFGEYPEELLPQHLKDIYREYKKELEELQKKRKRKQ